jgi:hyaluronan synthase
MYSQDDLNYCNELTITHCCQLAREILREHDIQLSSITKLCIYEAHMHKKAIMFTSFIFSIVISEELGIDYLWSSDSDTIVLPDSLQKTIATVAGDDNAGGGSSGLIVHNEHDTLWTKLGSAVYWCELYLTRSTSASSGTSDCQSGPSTVFRISALPGILYFWYTQKVMGRRMVSIFLNHLFCFVSDRPERL